MPRVEHEGRCPRCGAAATPAPCGCGYWPRTRPPSAPRASASAPHDREPIGTDAIVDRAENLRLAVWWLAGVGLAALATGTLWARAQFGSGFDEPAWGLANAVGAAGGGLMVAGAVVVVRAAGPTTQRQIHGLELGATGAAVVLVVRIGGAMLWGLVNAGAGVAQSELAVSAAGGAVAPALALALAARSRWWRSDPSQPDDHRAGTGPFRRRVAAGIPALIGLAGLLESGPWTARLLAMLPLELMWPWVACRLVYAVACGLLVLVGAEWAWRGWRRRPIPRRLQAATVGAAAMAVLGLAGDSLANPALPSTSGDLRIAVVAGAVADSVILALAAATAWRFGRR